MNKTGFVTTCDLINTKLEQHQLCGSKQCPSCGQKLQVKSDWVGLPAGVKFDPTDQELIEHLEAKLIQGKESKSHPLIDEFIPTIEGEDGICYTRPENLPGVRKDGLSRHFFHRPSKAYTTGTRKRRKILQMDEPDSGETRWHKTGKTRAVMVNGKQKGCKKILVLYTNFGKNRKPEKTNWVMHQYHLGKNEEEKEGELVVSKVFYQTQPRQCTDHRSVGGNKSNRHSTNVGPRISSCVEQLKPDNFGLLPFGETFDQAGNIGGEASMAREAQGAGGACGVRDMGQHHVIQKPEIPQHHVTNEHQYTHDQIASILHRSSISSTIISPTVSSIILDEDQSFNVPRIMLPDQDFQQQLHQDKVGGVRSASGLDELIMACTSSTHHTKQVSSITNPQETEWFKYSTFWPHPDHHYGL